MWFEGCCPPTGRDQPHRVASFGFTMRNHNGDVMVAIVACPVDTLSPLLAKASAFKWALSMASKLYFCHVRFETDCLQLFEALRSYSDGSSYLFSIFSDRRDLFSSFVSFDFTFVRITGNIVANHLSRNYRVFPNTFNIEEVPLDPACYCSE